MTTSDNINHRGYVSIKSQDGRNRIWIPRPDKNGIMHCTCGFGLKSHMPFVDAIDQLDYVHVEDVKQIDQDICCIILVCDGDHKGCLAKLMEDIPNIMEEHL